MKKILIFLLVFNIFGLWYLLSPLPALPPLANSVKSDLPGDTIQLKNVEAYFTNLSRTEVINFYKARLNGLFRLELNHPPEKARDIILDTIQSYYFEEFVFPFKESVYINGYDWQNDVFTKPEKRIANKLEFKGIEYQSKITVKTVPVPIISRLLAFWVVQMGIILIIYLYRSVFAKKI